MTHPLTPPPELVQKWYLHNRKHTSFEDFWHYFATQAARWGADQELEACVNWLIENQNPRWAHILQATRRPKPPSLKEQALAALNEIEDKMLGPTVQEKLIRRALETLPDD
jgi:hypothetical protein